MNDSFLEDLELIPKDSKKTNHQQVDRHVTTRHATSSPLVHFSEHERDDIESQKLCSIITVPNVPNEKITNDKDFSLKDSKKQSDLNIKKHSVKVKISEKNEKVKSKVKPMDIRIKTGNNKQQYVSGEDKIKLQEARYLKVPEKIVNKDCNRHSESQKEITLGSLTKEDRYSSNSSNSNSSSIFSKENNRPSDSSRENGSCDLAKEKEKLSSNFKKSGFNVQDQDPVALLTAIKELISTYTKQESTKILRVMQELHINSQSSLIKNLLYQTDDLIKEMHPSKDSARVKMLIEENERLQQELTILKMQFEDLQNKLEEFEFLKQENAALKSKWDKLTKI